MSFFLGKKSDGSDLMVATKDTKTISQLKAIAPINCEFHSSLPYLTYKKFDAVVRDYGYVTHMTGHLLTTNGGPTYSIVLAEFPEEFYTNYLDRHLIVIIDGEMSLSHFAMNYSIRNKFDAIDKLGQKWVSWEPYPPNTNYPLYTPVYTPSMSNRYLIVPKRALSLSDRTLDAPYIVPEVSVLVTNFKLDGTYVSPAVGDYAQGIKIKNNSFFINGYDLFSLNYLSNVSLSSADIAIATEQSSFYLVGEDDSVQGMQLLSAPGRTRLYKGLHVLFDTFYGRRGHVFSGATSYSVPNDYAIYGEYFDWYTDLLTSDNIAATDSTQVNVIVSVSITCNNVKYNGSSISGDFSNLPAYNYATKSYGAMSFCLTTSTDMLVGTDEYYIRTGTFSVLAMVYYKVYIRRVIESGRVKLRLIIKQNDDYTNTSATVSLSAKAIMFV